MAGGWNGQTGRAHTVRPYGRTGTRNPSCQGMTHSDGGGAVPALIEGGFRPAPYTVLWNVSCAAVCSCVFRLADCTVGVAMGR